MNFLLVVKILAGLTIGAVGLLVLFFVSFMIWLYWPGTKKHIKKEARKQLKTKIIHILQCYFAVGSFITLAFYFPITAALLGGGWLFYKDSSFKIGKQIKTKSSIRQRMEELRQQYQEQPLSKQERLALRKAKHLQHRQLFFYRLAKRRR